VGGFTLPAIREIERGQVERGHGTSNLPSQMIRRELGVKFKPGLRIFIPRWSRKMREPLGIAWGDDYHLGGLLMGCS
jgi:hypothetical protein